jgi:hypothetical protein
MTMWVRTMVECVRAWVCVCGTSHAVANGTAPAISQLSWSQHRETHVQVGGQRQVCCLWNAGLDDWGRS